MFSLTSSFSESDYIVYRHKTRHKRFEMMELSVKEAGQLSIITFHGGVFYSNKKQSTVFMYIASIHLLHICPDENYRFISFQTHCLSKHYHGKDINSPSVLSTRPISFHSWMQKRLWMKTSDSNFISVESRKQYYHLPFLVMLSTKINGRQPLCTEPDRSTGKVSQ